MSGQPPSRGHGSRHARGPLRTSIGAAISANPKNMADRMAADVTSALDAEAREREEREALRLRRQNRPGPPLSISEQERLDRLLAEMRHSVDRNTDAVNRNTAAIEENSRLLRRALNIDPVPEGAPVIDPSALMVRPDLAALPGQPRDDDPKD